MSQRAWALDAERVVVKPSAVRVVTQGWVERVVVDREEGRGREGSDQTVTDSGPALSLYLRCS